MATALTVLVRKRSFMLRPAVLGPQAGSTALVATCICLKPIYPYLATNLSSGYSSITFGTRGLLCALVTAPLYGGLRGCFCHRQCWVSDTCSTSHAAIAARWERTATRWSGGGGNEGGDEGGSGGGNKVAVAVAIAAMGMLQFKRRARFHRQHPAPGISRVPTLSCNCQRTNNPKLQVPSDVPHLSNQPCNKRTCCDALTSCFPLPSPVVSGIAQFFRVQPRCWV